MGVTAFEVPDAVSLRRGGAHALFWMGVLAFYTLFFGRAEANYAQSLLFVCLLLPVAVSTSYFVSYVLVPRFLLRRRYGLFALYFGYTLVASVQLELSVLVVSFIYLAEYRISAMNPAALDVFGLVVALYVVVFLFVAAGLVQRWHRLREAHGRAERARLEAELQLKEAELSRLKSQINPHFLFNTLNNLYGLTLEDPAAASEMVLRLADMLDYVLYRSDEAFVPLGEEVEHLESFLALERLRYDERVEVSFSVGEMPDEDVCIAPMLLLPFIENSFKHGVSRKAGSSWVRASLAVQNGQLLFEVANSRPQETPDEETNGEGIGLMNVRRRLELLYPDAYRLDLENEPEQYTVHLELPLRDCDDKMHDR